MRTIKSHTLGVIVSLGLATVAHSQGFDSGSDGSDGALVVPVGTTTLPMPEDGIFHFTTITIQNDGILQFASNALNTPVYLLAQGDVLINGTISVDGGLPRANFQGGLGGPGGFPGGDGRFQGAATGDGHGPGGGIYDNANGSQGGGGYSGSWLLSPLSGGAGASGGTDFSNNGKGGSGGAGAILIASSTEIRFVTGFVSAVGGDQAPSSNRGYSSGGGGAIRIIAPVVSGTGTLNVAGGAVDSQSIPRRSGSSGRARIDSLDRAAHRSVNFVGPGVRGSQMFVFGPPRSLKVIHAAGNDIPDDQATPVAITLPSGTPQEQTVRIQATGFDEDVPITVRVVPENGASASYDATIPNPNGGSASVDVTVTLPIDVVSHLNVFSR